MLAESYLRTRTQIILYAASSVLFLLLAIQNYRFGNYNLFYSGLLLLPALTAGAVYAWLNRSESGAYRGHFAVLVFIFVVVLSDLSARNAASIHWLYGVGLFSFLLLPLKFAFNFNLVVLLVSSVFSLFAFDFGTMLRFSTSYALLVGLAGLYAYLYHHKARFLDETGITEGLTGAYNMRHWDMTLRQEVSRSEVTDHPLSLLALEIDYYEQILEVNGINFTNELVAEVGKLLHSLTRAGDSIYHDREGRFFFLLPSTDEEGLLVFGERLRRAVAEKTWPVVESISVSVGCLTRPAGMLEGHELMEHLNDALSQSQKTGHNKVTLKKF